MKELYLIGSALYKEPEEVNDYDFAIRDVPAGNFFKFYGDGLRHTENVKQMSKQKWKNCILETTGLNCRETFLKAALPILQRVTIKLETQRKVVYARIAKKKKDEQGGEWLFMKDYHDKYEFVRKLFKAFKLIPAEIRINTSKLDKDAVYKIALEKLRLYVIP